MNGEKSAFALREADGAGSRDPDKAELAVRYGIIPTTAPMSALAHHVHMTFLRNAEHRRASGIDMRLVRAMRACRLEYSPEEVARLEEAGLSPDVYTPITDVKRRAASAQLGNLFNAKGQKPWTLSPTPVPEVPAGVLAECIRKVIGRFMAVCQSAGQVPPPQAAMDFAMRQMGVIRDEQTAWARQKAGRMEELVYDQLVEGGWDGAFALFLNYLCTYGTALILGPETRVMPVAGCKEGRLGELKYEMECRAIPCFEAVNPWDCYPSPGARKVTDGALCVRVRYTADELWRYASDARGKGEPGKGWMPQTVRSLLSKYPEGGCRIPMQPYDPIRRRLENDGVNIGNDCTLEGIRCFSVVRGSVLRDFGILRDAGGRTVDPARFYQAEVISVADFIVYCRLVDPRIGIPVSKGVFYESVGSWWGDSIADKLVSCQKIMNASLKNLVRNMAMASGAMLWMGDASRLVDTSPGRFRAAPHKMWAFNTGMMGGGGPPMGVIDIPSHVKEILDTFARINAQADFDSGIPAYTVGAGPTPGALRTASGLATFMEASGLVMKGVALGVDECVVRNVVRMMVRRILVYGDDLSVKGDCDVNPSGLVGQLLRAVESEGRQRVLAMINADPMMKQLVGVKGTVALMRPELDALGINPNDVLPGEQEMEFYMQLQKVQAVNAAAPQGGGQGGGQPPPRQAGRGRVQERRAVA